MNDYIKFDGSDESINAILEIFNLESLDSMGAKVNGPEDNCLGIRFKFGEQSRFVIKYPKKKLLELELSIGDLVVGGLIGGRTETISVIFADSSKEDLDIERLD